MHAQQQVQEEPQVEALRVQLEGEIERQQVVISQQEVGISQMLADAAQLQAQTAQLQANRNLTTPLQALQVQVAAVSTQAEDNGLDATDTTVTLAGSFPLPPGLFPAWHLAEDPATGKVYFYNTTTGVAQWDPPFILAVHDGDTATVRTLLSTADAQSMINYQDASGAD
jgi:hypothetical protein